jgi:hypothetical protein
MIRTTPLLVLLAAACQTAPSQGTQGAAVTVGGAEQAGSSNAQVKVAPREASPSALRKRSAEADTKFAEARRALRVKAAERELAELAAAATARDSDEAVRAARVALEMARADRVRFDAMERPVKIGEVALSVGQAEERLRVAETDLLGILEIFEEESEARAKDEIIRRNEIAVQTAKARVEQAQIKQAMVVEGELPARMAKLSEAVRACEAKLAAAEAKAEQAKRRATLDVGVAKNEEAEARKALSKAEKERAKIRKRLKAAKAEADGAEGASPGAAGSGAAGSGAAGSGSAGSGSAASGDQ